ncbi:MAG: glycogen/starch/alpha-glucan phosphorylase [Eubacteriales bacterium]
MAQYTKEHLEDAITKKLQRYFGRDLEEASNAHMFKACALVLRDIMAENRSVTSNSLWQNEARQIHYLSLEFLMGRSLEKNAYNLGVLPELQAAVESFGFNLTDLFETEPDAGLGNGGLGRLAACYLDAMTTQEIPALGYSIRYELGIFKQKIVDGRQVELADNWLGLGDAWLIPKVDKTEHIRFGGRIEDNWDEYGVNHPVHVDYSTVLAIPCDMQIAGYKTNHTNMLRLWDAKSPVSADMALYSRGDYLKAVEQQAMAEVIAKVLYPDDNHYEGKSLRLKQQYFFVSATVQSIIRKHKAYYGTLRNFHEKHVLQINDTHPTLVIPELMRILMDNEGYSWNDAWEIVKNSVCYTNHTVLSEALERWPQGLIENLLPRVWSIIQEIARRYQVVLEKTFPDNWAKIAGMAILWDNEVRMANLCIATCPSVNGVSALHSDILKNDVFKDAHSMNPEQIKNVTNGIDHRRWLAQINPDLSKLIADCCGSDEYLLKPELLSKFEAHKSDAAVLKKLGAIKKANKQRFADYIAKETGVVLNTDGVFDVQVKRLHEYKRQLLNVLHIISLYHKLRENPNMEFTPQVFLFGAKAAPGYHVAKQIIQLINSLSVQIANDPICKDKLQVVFLENYRVSLAEKLLPASELSQQISTAGKEASGTGNMKFMMNGALTIGTLDGANVEMHEKLGDENIFLFGLTTPEVSEKYHNGHNPLEYYTHDPILKGVLDQLSHGFDDGISYSDLTNRLLFGTNGSMADEYLLLADFKSYCEAEARAIKAYSNQKEWNKTSLINISRSGIFAADRSIADYARTIWHVPVRNGGEG